MQEEKTVHLKFFGIGRIAPYLRSVRKMLLIMVVCGLASSAIDIILPLFQRYALDHVVGEMTFDTIVLFLILYVLTVAIAAVVNYISCSLAITVEMTANRELRKTGFEHLQKLSFFKIPP